MARAYYRVLREADASSTVDADVYSADPKDDPTLADYAALGITVADAVGTGTYSDTTGVGNESLDLLNDAIDQRAPARWTAWRNLHLATTANDVML